MKCFKDYIIKESGVQADVVCNPYPIHLWFDKLAHSYKGSKQFVDRKYKPDDYMTISQKEEIQDYFHENWPSALQDSHEDEVYIIWGNSKSKSDGAYPHDFNIEEFLTKFKPKKLVRENEYENDLIIWKDGNKDCVFSKIDKGDYYNWCFVADTSFYTNNLNWEITR